MKKIRLVYPDISTRSKVAERKMETLVRMRGGTVVDISHDYDENTILVDVEAPDDDEIADISAWARETGWTVQDIPEEKGEDE